MKDTPQAIKLRFLIVLVVIAAIDGICLNTQIVFAENTSAARGPGAVLPDRKLETGRGRERRALGNPCRPRQPSQGQHPAGIRGGRGHYQQRIDASNEIPQTLGVWDARGGQTRPQDPRYTVTGSGTGMSSKSGS